MEAKALLEQIWSGSVTLFGQGEAGEIARGIRALMPVETVSLVNAGRHDLPRVMSESEELLPGLPLGDVLNEELGIEVPFGALVVFEEVAGEAGAEGRPGAALSCEDKALRHIAPTRGTRGSGGAERAARGGAEIAAEFRDGGLNAQFFGAGARPRKLAEAGQGARSDRALG